LAQQQQSPFPPIPEEPVEEGGRWRHHKPTSEAVAAWFRTQPLDEDMKHEDYVGGVVIIPQTEKVKYSRRDGQGTVERHEQIFTPYVQIGTRLGYFRRLAEQRSLIPVVEPEPVPRSENPSSIYFNGNLPDGLWWHVIATGEGRSQRFLCATYRVSMYEPQSYGARLSDRPPLPRLVGTGTKMVSERFHSGNIDVNALMKAQTGAIGRALGVAGILVIGTGIATADDMQEFVGETTAAPAPTLPDPLPQGEAPPAEAETLEGLRARALALQTQLQEVPEAEGREQPWTQFVAWWKERAAEEGWTNLSDVPQDALKGVIVKMERIYEEASHAQ
jgi:hypothetical protein